MVTAVGGFLLIRLQLSLSLSLSLEIVGKEEEKKKQAKKTPRLLRSSAQARVVEEKDAVCSGRWIGLGYLIFTEDEFWLKQGDRADDGLVGSAHGGGRGLVQTDRPGCGRDPRRRGRGEERTGYGSEACSRLELNATTAIFP